MVINETVDACLLSAPHLTPAGFLNQAIDALAEIVPGDSVLEAGPTTTKRFRLTCERFDKLARIAADTGFSENDVAIAAIRHYARNPKP